MAFSDTDVKATYNGNGSNTTFAIPFQVIVDDSSEVLVYVRDETDPDVITEELQTEGALQDYTLTGASPPGTPFDTNVEFNTAPTATQKVIVIRKLPLTQVLDMTTSGDFLPESQETAFDRVVAMIQQVDERTRRVPIMRVTQQTGELELEEPGAGCLLGYNDDGDAVICYTMDDLADALQTGQLLTEYQQLLNNNASADIDSMLLDSATYRSYMIDYAIERRTTTDSIRATGMLIFEYDAKISAWKLPTDVNFTDGHGVSFSISGAGQVSYSSDTMSGSTYVGHITWKIRRRFTSEA